MTRRFVRLALALAATAGLTAMLSAQTACAGQPVSLRDTPSSGPQVTLGDLFDRAGDAGSVVVGFGAPNGQSAVLDADEVQHLARLHGLDWDNPDAIHRILVRSGEAPRAAPKAHTVEALTYTRSLASGETVQPQDIGYAQVATFALPGDAPRDAETVIGMIARRPLRMGAPVAAHDVSPAQVIKRDDIVEVAYGADGISLVLQGKAMASAAIGDPLPIMNTNSKKVIQAVAVGPDQAVVGPDAERARVVVGGLPSQFASLR